MLKPILQTSPLCRFGWTLGLLAVLAPATTSRGQVTEEQVRRAIQRGVSYLKQVQVAQSGGWSEHPGEPGGASALCLLAMINSGAPLSDPAVQKGLEYLRQMPAPDRTYSTSLMLMTLAAADPKRDALLIQRCAKWLQEAQVSEGRQAGSWSYSSGGGGGGGGDASNAQFALLALYEAERLGVAIPDRLWSSAREFWTQLQTNDGAWTYRIGDSNPSGSMTCAGLSSTIIVNGRLNPPEASIVNGQVVCCGQPTAEPNLSRGLQWLGNNYSVSGNPSGSLGTYYYYMYGLERVGRLSATRFIGRRDWYREGAEQLVRQQDPLTGAWRSGVGLEPHINTAFALLFLAKGRRPIVVSRLRHGPGDDWNRHRASIPNLVRRVEASWKIDLTWQTIDLRAAATEDLLLSPVLFLSGSEALQLTQEQKQQLRDYVNQGGFLFCEGCQGCGCEGADFDQSLRAFLQEMFPESPLRKLPPEHAAWFADAPIDPQALPENLWLWGVEACCRTSVIYCPHPLSCYWELADPRRSKDYAEPAASQIESCLRVGQNVLAYATNRQLKGKLDRPDLTAAAPGQRLARGVLSVPKLNHEGGADDAPNALHNLLQLAGQAMEMRINTDPLMLSATDEKLYRYPIVFLHGRRTFSFSASERKALRQFLERGGFVIADSICGSTQFADSVRREFQAIVPEQTFRSLAPDHPLLTREFQGFDLSSVTIRDPKARADRNAPLESRLTQGAPVLEGLYVGDRLAVLLSPLDLSCALENQASLECKGYTREDAARIGINALLYGLQQ